jgi:hypothetical protein
MATALTKYLRLNEVVKHLENGPDRLIPPPQRNPDGQRFLTSTTYLSQFYLPQGELICYSLFLAPINVPPYPPVIRRLIWDRDSDKLRCESRAVLTYPSVLLEYFQVPHDVFREVEGAVANYEAAFPKSLTEVVEHIDPIPVGWKLVESGRGGIKPSGESYAQPGPRARRMSLGQEAMLIEASFMEGSYPQLDAAWDHLWSAFEGACLPSASVEGYTEDYLIPPRYLVRADEANKTG